MTQKKNRKKLKNELTEMAGEWLPEGTEVSLGQGDVESSASVSPGENEIETELMKDSIVSFVSNPMTVAHPSSFSSTVDEIREAQKNEDEIEDLDADLSEVDLDEEPLVLNPMSDDVLEGLKVRVAVEDDKVSEELSALRDAQKLEADARLKLEIAEQDLIDLEVSRINSENELTSNEGSPVPSDESGFADERSGEGSETSDEELSDQTHMLDVIELQSCIEALLFMSDKPISAEKLRDQLGPDYPMQNFLEALTALEDRYRQPQYGIEMVQVAGGYQLRTKPARALLAKKLAKVTLQKLSTGTMESLAIIAYKQPVLKDEIDKIRGVDSSHFVRILMDRKLVLMSGRSELPGRPILYSTTPEFLEIFGLNSLDDLPPLPELESMIPQSAVGVDESDPRVKQIRSLVATMNSDTGDLNYDPKEDDELLKEIRERVQSISVSTPYIDEIKAQEKASAQGLDHPQVPVAPSMDSNGQAQMPGV